MTMPPLPPYYSAREAARVLGYRTPQHFHNDRRRDERAWDPVTGEKSPLPAFANAAERASYVKTYPVCAPTFGGYRVPGQDWRFAPQVIHALAAGRLRPVNLPPPPPWAVIPADEAS